MAIRRGAGSPAAGKGRRTLADDPSRLCRRLRGQVRQTRAPGFWLLSGHARTRPTRYRRSPTRSSSSMPRRSLGRSSASPVCPSDHCIPACPSRKRVRCTMPSPTATSFAAPSSTPSGPASSTTSEGTLLTRASSARPRHHGHLLDLSHALGLYPPLVERGHVQAQLPALPAQLFELAARQVPGIDQTE